MQPDFVFARAKNLTIVYFKYQYHAPSVTSKYHASYTSCIYIDPALITESTYYYHSIID